MSYVYQPVAAQERDGRLSVFAIIGGVVNVCTQLSQGNFDAWGTWETIGNLTNVASNIEVVSYTDGSLGLLTVYNQNVYYTHQQDNGSWPDWTNLGGAVSSNVVNGMTVAVDTYHAPNKAVNIFISSDTGIQVNNTLQPNIWQTLPMPYFEVAGGFAAGRNAYGELQLFACDGNGNVFSASQGVTWPSAWTELGNGSTNGSYPCVINASLPFGSGFIVATGAPQSLQALWHVSPYGLTDWNPDGFQTISTSVLAAQGSIAMASVPGSEVVLACMQDGNCYYGTWLMPSTAVNWQSFNQKASVCSAAINSDLSVAAFFTNRGTGQIFYAHTVGLTSVFGPVQQIYPQ